MHCFLFMEFNIASREGIRRGAQSESSDGGESEISVDSESSSHLTKKRVSTAKARTTVKRASPKKSQPAKKSPTKSGKSSVKSTPKPRKPESESDEDEGNVSDAEDQTALRVMKALNRSPKEQLVADLLCRWWYVLPDWPPANFDYGKSLRENNLRVVPLDKWETEEDFDSEKRMKCYALSQYQGMFRDALGALRDLRPLEGKPCYTEFVKKSEKELAGLLAQALSKQIEILTNSSEKNTQSLIVELKEKLKAVNKK